VWLGSNQTTNKLAVRTASGEIVDIDAIAHAVTGRNRPSGFYVVHENNTQPYAAALYEVTLEGVATKVIDYGALPATTAVYHQTVDAAGNLYERQGQTIVKRPVDGGAVQVVFDEASATKPAIALDKTPPTLPLLFSAQGGLVTGP
jgi:hypothetical protein